MEVNPGLILLVSGILALFLFAVFWALWVLRKRQASWRSTAETLLSEAQTLRQALSLAEIEVFLLEDSRLTPLSATSKRAAESIALPRLLDRFAAPEAAALEMALRRLEAEGQAFDLALEPLPSESLASESRGAARGLYLSISGRFLAEAEGPGPALLVIAAAPALARQRQEAMLEAGRLRTLIDALPLPIWRRDANLDLLDCNEAYGEAVGRSVARALAEKTELLGELGRLDATGLAEAARSSGRMERMARHAVIGGKRRLLDLRELSLADGSLVGYAFDRTEVEEIQGELSRHLAAQEEVLEALATGIAVLGPDMRLKFHNSAFAVLWRLEETFLREEPPIEEILERLRVKRALPEQSDFRAYRREVVDRYRRLTETEEELIHRPDGSTLLETMTPHPFGGVLLTFEDVTDRLTLERSYNTLIAVQRETIENLHEAVAVFGSDGRLALANRTFATLWGLSPDVLEERPHIRELLSTARGCFARSDADWQRFVERVVAEATEPQARAGRMERPDGSVIDWAQVPLPDGQSLFSYLDVSDSIQVERALRERAEALETADRLKSEFIANVSYELRTPLNAIIGFAEILKNEFFGQLNARQSEYAGAIVESSQRLTQLINDILDLATIEAGYLQLDREPVEVRRLLQSVESLGFERARTCGLELVLDCPDDIGTVLGDERRLKQALFNLLSNAFKFTPEGGSVTLLARRAEGEILLSVTDTGVGIAQEDQVRVFEKFDRGRSRKSGAGLGLSLVKSLIELHGGAVELTSRKGGGTRAICRLPSGEAAAAAKTA